MASPSGTTTPTAPTAAPGPIYDNAFRLLAGLDLNTVCTGLGLPTGPGPVRRSEALPAATQHADLIAQTGPHRLAHIEFVRKAQDDMPLRMLEYRARIMTLNRPATLTQHVVVLAQGTIRPELSDPPDLTLTFNVIYLRDKHPDDLLTSPSLAPMAVLARAGNPLSVRLL